MCGVEASYTLDTGTRKRDAHLKFDGHRGPEGQPVVCSQMIVLRGQDGWSAGAERRSHEVRRREGFE